MAKITVTGDAVAVKSTLTLEDIRTVEKYRPEALVLMSDDEEREPLFAVCTTTGAGSISSFGASFGRESHDEDKLAIITMIMTEPKENVVDWVADHLGRAVLYLNKLEEKIPAVLEEIATEKAAIIRNIQVSE